MTNMGVLAIVLPLINKLMDIDKILDENLIGLWNELLEYDVCRTDREFGNDIKEFYRGVIKEIILEYGKYKVQKLKGQEQAQELPKLPLQELYDLYMSIFGIECMEHTRKTDFVIGRMVFFTIAREMNYTLMALERFSGIDHSSIILSQSKSKKLQYQEYKDGVKQFRDKVKEYINE